MYIRDNEDGEVRLYGKNCHDSLAISADGRCLYYYNLQNGDGSRCGGYSFVTDEKGYTPIEDEDLQAYGAEGYFDIGGFMCRYREGYEKAIADIKAGIETTEENFKAKHPDYDTTDDKYVVAVMATLKVCKELVVQRAIQPEGDTKAGAGV